MTDESSARFLVRPAKEMDLPLVAEIDQEAFSPYGTAEAPEIIAARLAVFPEGFIVLESAGTVAGYGSSEKWTHDGEPVMNQDPAQTHDPAGQVFCITAMAVRTAHWGKGFGSALLDRLISIARQQGCRRVILETTHAQEFYLKRGFTVVGKRQQYDVTLSVLQRLL